MPQENALPRVELWSGRIPVVGTIAHHYWFVIDSGHGRNRWEVWQTRDNSATSWGYLHKNLMAPEAWLNKQPRRRVIAWDGAEAVTLIERIEAAPETYPWLNRYRYWPGPNSNTFVQWILREEYALGPNAIGRRYARRSAPA